MFSTITLQIRSSLVILLLATSLLGCTMGGKAKEKIHDGIYSNSIGSEPNAASFRVAAPSGYPYYLEAREEIGPGFTYIAFWSEIDTYLYRALIGQRDDVPFEVFKERSFPLITSMVPSDEPPLKERYKKDITVHGQPAVYAVYTQEYPGGFNLLMQNEAAQTLTHAIYMIYYEDYLVLLWGQFSNLSPSIIVDEQNRKSLYDRSFAPMNNYVDSFQIIYPNKK